MSLLICTSCGASTRYRGRKREFARHLGWSRSKESFRCPACRLPDPATATRTAHCRIPGCTSTLDYTGQLPAAARAAGWTYSSGQPKCPYPHMPTKKDPR